MHFGGGTVTLADQFCEVNSRLPYYQLDIERFFRPVPHCPGHWEQAYAELSVDVSLDFPNGKLPSGVCVPGQDALAWAVRESQSWLAQSKES